MILAAGAGDGLIVT